MIDLSGFDVNSVGNPNNNIFGLPFEEENARLIILPVPWEVTVSFGSGTARSAEQVFKASLQVDSFDRDMPDTWKEGFYLKDSDKKILLKSDYLRKAALYRCARVGAKFWIKAVNIKTDVNFFWQLGHYIVHNLFKSFSFILPYAYILIKISSDPAFII